MSKKPRLHRDWIDPFALQIVERLQRAGFETYLVGGCVRDLLCGIVPKDYDIATMARPEQIKDIVPRAYIIGKRFRLVLVKRGNDQFEVATFRRDPPPEDSTNEEGLQIRDNVFGTPEEDARRRDFTINSFFYDPSNDKLVDFCGGLKDIEDRTLRIIGDPLVRLTEDPIRILRAIRLAHKLNFSIEPTLKQAIVEKAHLIKMSVLPRRREELLKILKLQDPAQTLHECSDLGILENVFPTLDKILRDKSTVDDFDTYMHRFSELNHMDLAPEFLFGILALIYVRTRIEHDPHADLSGNDLREHKDLNEFLKNELGVFNLESLKILRGIQVQPELVKNTDFEKRGQRRKLAFIRNEALPLSLFFANIDHTLTAKQLHFWEEQLQLAPIPDESDESSEYSHPPRRRRRRRQRRPRHN